MDTTVYKKILATNIIETSDKNFVSQSQLDSIQSSNDLLNNLKIINERVLIENSQFILSNTPVDSKLIYDLIMITEDINNDIVIQYELFQDYSIQDKTITLNTPDFNNYKALVSYLTL